MNTRQIIENCYPCGYRELVVARGVPLSLDFCRRTAVECSKVKSCDPILRKPKEKKVRRRKKVMEL